MRIFSSTSLAILAVASPLSAGAATIVQSYGPQSGPQTFARFDPALGTLNAVIGEFSGTEIAQIQTTLTGPVSVDYIAKGFYSVYIGPLYFDFTGSAQGTGVSAIDTSGVGTITLSGGTTQTRALPSELAFFSSSGTIFASPSIDPPFLVTLSSGSITGAPVVLSSLTSYKLTYDYTPFALPVPEPLTWAMFVMGFGLTGWQLRRRTNRVLNATLQPACRQHG